MDSSPQSASSLSDEFRTSLPAHLEDDVEEAEPHIHMPNPSYWPILLSIAIAIAISGLLFISSFPWIFIVALPFVLIFIVAWGVEDPIAPKKEKFVTVYRVIDPWKYKIGQNVIDAQGHWLGTVQARFSRYILVERGHLFLKVFYVPQSAVKDQVKDNAVFLTLSEVDLVRMGYNTMPDDLYDEVSDVEVRSVRGIPQFARRPLSPAETGHYNYGRMSPGINTDASGSYHREEVHPEPQTYVTEDIFTTDEPIPPRTISPD
jgi:hypothetical protein